MSFKTMNLPNKITTIRMLLVPVVLILIVISWVLNNSNADIAEIIRIIAAILFLAASLTDFLDGYIARKNNVVTNYGKIMDPLADKLLVDSTLILIAAAGMLICNDKILDAMTILAVTIIIARDIFVDALRMAAVQRGTVVAAKFWGKLKTFTLMPGVALLIFATSGSIVLHIGLGLIYLGAIFSLISGIDYFILMKPHLGE